MGGDRDDGFGSDKVVPFPAHREPRAPAAPLPVMTIRLNARRFVYDVRRWDDAFAVTFEGKPITRHASVETAVQNARLIASNFWAMGQPTAVRVVNADQTITPVCSFG